MWHLTDRPLDESICDFVASARLLSWQKIKAEHESCEDPDTAISLEKPENILEFAQEFSNKLDQRSDAEGIPLSHVVRAESDVPDHASDDTSGEPDSTCTTCREESKIRTLHTSDEFRRDTKRVCQIPHDALDEF